MDDLARNLPRDERLRKRGQFLKVYAEGDKIFTRYFVLYLRPNDQQCHRLGLTVSKKIGKAVVRNRVRRRLREIFRQSKERIPEYCDVVINVRRAAAKGSYEELAGDFEYAARRWSHGRSGR